MRKLGYSAYGAQGGDWGAMATSYVGLLDPEHCRAIHLNMVAVPRPRDENILETLSADELTTLAKMRESMKDEMGYQAIQGTKPQTLGYGLSDSPAGLAGWIIEKFRAWGDTGDRAADALHQGRASRQRHALLAHQHHHVLRRVSTTSRAARDDSGRSKPRVTVPTGCAIFPHEMYRPPRRWAERLYNVQRWTRCRRAGTSRRSKSRPARGRHSRFLPCLPQRFSLALEIAPAEPVGSTKHAAARGTP